MHDLKHLTSKRTIFSFSKLTRKKRVSRNSFNSLAETSKKRGRLRILLPFLALLLALYPLVFLLKSSAPLFSSVAKAASKRAGKTTEPLDSYKSFRIAAEILKQSSTAGNRLMAPLSDGGKVLFTIDPALQDRVHKIMVEKEVPYGVFVAIEPKTGKILALTSYSAIDPTWAEASYFRLYPMASLFKIITASAALEQKKVEPDTMFVFRGYSYSENPRYWSVKPGQGGQQMPLSLALGKSINPVFGRLASDVVGKDSIMSYAQRFGFNQNLFPGTPVIPSRAAVPQDDLELKLMGAGLGREVKISPLHAALMMAAIANQGTMMAPLLAQEIRDNRNGVLFTELPQSIRRLVTAETAGQLSKMLLTTIRSGTSRRAFHDRQGRPKLASVDICAKTGSINGREPEGSYSWFAAYAPAEDPKIALVALIINQDKWKIKASHLGEQALEQFFSTEVPRSAALGS
jgi:cell division protein FtsI/penicillin-binding protein 2